MKSNIEKVIIRKAREEDCFAMLDLVKELAKYENAPEEVTISLEEFTLSGFGKNPIWGAFVAEKNNIIIGISLYYTRFSTWKGKRLYLEDLIVTEKERGKQTGKQLFEATLEYAKTENYHGMVWQVLDWNEPGINFYKKYNSNFDGEWINVSIDF